MSHTTQIGNVAIRDIPALRSAAQELKDKGTMCELVEKAHPRLWAQGPLCDYVLKLPQCRFDVGFAKQADGSYSPITDLHGGMIGKEIGAGPSCPMPNTHEGRAQHAIGALMQSYTKFATINVARSKGMSVASARVDDQGKVQLVLNAA